jgi:hypothetical protein
MSATERTVAVHHIKGRFMTKIAFLRGPHVPNRHSVTDQQIARAQCAMLIHDRKKLDFSHASASFALVLPSGAASDAQSANAVQTIVCKIEVSK